MEVPKDNSEFKNIIIDIVENPTVQEMKNYRQHYDTSCFEHCVNVSYISYKVCKKMNLDYKSAARAAMVHDLFLYDWRKRENGRKGLHAFTHPKTSLENALKIFELSDKEQDIILKHMWPLTIKFPRYAESWIVTFVDKYCAVSESFNHYFKRKKPNFLA
ncbi:MAG: HD family phosphohydrolase [Clostridia bacterium]|nr:HD family phosphohydrolase [Clostridia bacterium]